jgi:hypothetical protein
VHREAGHAPALSANVRETASRPKFSVEGEQATAARDDINQPSPCSPALPDGSDVQGQEAALQRRVQEEGHDPIWLSIPRLPFFRSLLEKVPSQRGSLRGRKVAGRRRTANGDAIVKDS